jgi:GNAT superfamily N-acetyltransferase/ketosteroid isomerase-like protein
MMSELKQLAKDFLKAIASTDIALYEAVLDDDASLLIGRWDGGEVYRPRRRVVERLIGEWSARPDATLEEFTIIVEGDLAAVEFRIQATENQRYVEHNRSAFLKIKDGRIQVINLYCPEPMPSSRRKGWIAPATMTEDELQRLFGSLFFSNDSREGVMPNLGGRMSLRGGMEGSGDAHPGSNFVGGIRWSSAEADARIEETIAYHRERNVGFQWFVSPYDTPSDLGERLEKHGLVLAGDADTMARLGLDDLDDIPTNPDLTVSILDGSDHKLLDALAYIMKICFNWSQEQVDQRMPGLIERMRDERFREREINYVGILKGEPIGLGRLVMRSGVAYLGGAATLPEFRGQKVYSTLLRRRLEDARARGYHLAAINAEPMSRRIVTRYGFKEYARICIYGWMPVMDVDVIKSLVPQ